MRKDTAAKLEAWQTAEVEAAVEAAGKVFGIVEEGYTIIELGRRWNRKRKSTEEKVRDLIAAGTWKRIGRKMGPNGRPINAYMPVLKAGTQK